MEKAIIKKFLSHEHKAVRKYAANYFVDAYTGDLEITEIFLKQIESGIKDREIISILSYLSKLPHTKDTLERIHKMYSEYNQNTEWINRIFISADIELLKKNPHLRPKSNAGNNKINKRIQLADTETKKLWKELWKHSENGKGKNFGSFDYSYGTWIIDELSKRKDFDHSLFFEMLHKNYSNSYSGWDDIYLCYLSGELKDRDSIPFLIRCVNIDGDFICEKACDALVKIGSSEVVEAVEESYTGNEFHYKIYATDILERLKLKASEKCMLRLLPTENDITLKTNLAYGLCKHFSLEGIPSVLTLIYYGYDKMSVNLEESIFVNHIVNNIEHKDMKLWDKSITRDDKTYNEVMEKVLNGNISKEDMNEGLKNYMRRQKETDRLNSFYSGDYSNVGRNHLCPCGSGKKYKKCCLS